MPLASALYGSNPPTTGVYGNTLYARNMLVQVAVIPFESEGFRLGPGFDLFFYEVINRGTSVPQLVSV